MYVRRLTIGFRHSSLLRLRCLRPFDCLHGSVSGCGDCTGRGLKPVKGGATGDGDGDRYRWGEGAGGETSGKNGSSSGTPKGRGAGLGGLDGDGDGRGDARGGLTG